MFILTVLFLQSSSGLTEDNLDFTNLKTGERGLAEFGGKTLFSTTVAKELLSFSALLMSLKCVIEAKC